MLDMIDAASLQWARESRVLQVKLQNLSSRATYQTAVHTTHKHACEELLDHIVDPALPCNTAGSKIQTRDSTER